MKYLINGILCFMVALVLLLACPVQAAAQADSLPATAAGELLAAPGGGISPMMLYIYRVTTSLSISANGNATALGTIMGYPGVTDEVWIYLYLEIYVNGTWQTYRSWSQTFENYYGSLQAIAAVPSGFYYRVKGSYYGWSGGASDHVINYSISVYH